MIEAILNIYFSAVVSMNKSMVFFNYIIDHDTNNILNIKYRLYSNQITSVLSGFWV